MKRLVLLVLIFSALSSTGCSQVVKAIGRAGSNTARVTTPTVNTVGKVTSNVVKHGGDNLIQLGVGSNDRQKKRQ